MTQAVAAINKAVAVNQLFNESLIARWLKFSAVSKKSVMTYRGALKQLFIYFRDNCISKPSRADIEDWRDMLIDGGKSPSTIALYMTSAKLFFRFLSDENLYANVADHIKNGVKISKEHKKDCLSKAQAKQLLNSITGDSLKARRDRAVVALMLSAGLRTIEISRANVGDLHFVGGACFLRVQGKGRSSKDAEIRVAPQVLSILQDYLTARGKAKSRDPLFISVANRNRGQRISTQVVSKMVKGYLRGIGIDSSRVTAHSLRHFAATQALLEGASLESVSQVLRHSNIGVTMIYAHHVQRLKNNAEVLVANSLFSENKKE